MNAARRLFFLLALAAHLLAGCSTTAIENRREGPPSDSWSGRMALNLATEPPQAFFATFELKGTADAGELSLISPLGNVVAEMRWAPGDARLRNGQTTHQADSVEALSREATGTALPIQALFDWLKGVGTTAGGWQPDLSQLGQGRLRARREVGAGRGTEADPGCAVRNRGTEDDNPAMKSLYDVPAPAKLNLFLHVTGRRPDGYHLLQSVFMLIDWCDTLHFELRSDGVITRRDLTEALPPDDLVIRAARSLQSFSQCPLGVDISVEKRVPAQAGMGGGSSDAASCLMALSRLWKLNLSIEQLLALAIRLGADVPFFVRGRNAWVEGVGDIITPLELPSARFVVIKPPVGVETAAIFASQDLKRDTIPATISGFAAHPYDFGRTEIQPPAAGWQGRPWGNLEFHPMLGWAPSAD